MNSELKSELKHAWEQTHLRHAREEAALLTEPIPPPPAVLVPLLGMLGMGVTFGKALHDAVFVHELPIAVQAWVVSLLAGAFLAGLAVLACEEAAFLAPVSRISQKLLWALAALLFPAGIFCLRIGLGDPLPEATGWTLLEFGTVVFVELHAMAKQDAWQHFRALHASWAASQARVRALTSPSPPSAPPSP